MLNYNNVKKIWLKGISFVLLIVINGVSMTSEENEIIVGSKESQEEESSWDKAHREERERIEEIRTMTKGKGTFSMVITNTGSGVETIRVSIYITNPPSGCEYLGGGQLGFLYSNLVRIIPNETITLGLPAPFMSSQDDLEQYDNTDNLLPLSEDSEVIIKIKNTHNTRGLFCYPKYKKVFKAKYLSGTRLIDLPKEIPVNINHDNDNCELPSWCQQLLSYEVPQEFLDLVAESRKKFGF